jgi:hypothetical protein
MNHYIRLVVLSLALSTSAHGMEVDYDITPEQLERFDHVFSVTTKETPEGVAFSITITYKTPRDPLLGPVISGDRSGHTTVYTYKMLEMIPPSTIARLLVITSKQGSVSSDSLPNLPPVTLKKDVRTWQADFVLPRELMGMPDLYFWVSAVPEAVLLDDKGDNPYLRKDAPVSPGYLDFKIRLRDFLKLSKEETDAQTKKLSGTFWTTWAAKVESNWFCLNADGTVTTGWHEPGDTEDDRSGHWQVVGDLAVEFQQMSKVSLKKTGKILRFDTELKRGEGVRRIANRILSPTKEMLDKAAHPSTPPGSS